MHWLVLALALVLSQCCHSVHRHSVYRFRQLERRLQFQKISLWNPVSNVCGLRGASTPLWCKRKAELQQKCFVWCENLCHVNFPYNAVMWMQPERLRVPDLVGEGIPETQSCSGESTVPETVQVGLGGRQKASWGESKVPWGTIIMVQFDS